MCRAPCVLYVCLLPGPPTASAGARFCPTWQMRKARLREVSGTPRQEVMPSNLAFPHPAGSAVPLAQRSADILVRGSEGFTESPEDGTAQMVETRLRPSSVGPWGRAGLPQLRQRAVSCCPSAAPVPGVWVEAGIAGTVRSSVLVQRAQGRSPRPRKVGRQPACPGPASISRGLGGRSCLEGL